MLQSIIGNNDPIITELMGNNETVIIGNIDVITKVIIRNNNRNNVIIRPLLL